MPKPNTTPSPHALPWALAIFPVLEAVFFIASALALQHSIWLALFFLLLASLNLSFAIHIFFHECVHAKSDYSNLFKWPASILLGLPFDGYRVHHYNHHSFENSEHDFSTTWIWENGAARPRSAWSYTFGWPRQLVRSVKCLTPFGGTPDAANRIKQRIPSQKKALLLNFIILLLIGWEYLLLYIALIYFGWAFTSLHNYGQHPPIEKIDVSTYASAWYNQLFFNNGLHWEHHHFPTLSWQEIRLHPDSPRIMQPHIIHPLMIAYLPEKENG